MAELNRPYRVNPDLGDDYSNKWHWAGEMASSLNRISKYIPEIVEYNKAVHRNKINNQESFDSFNRVVDSIEQDSEIVEYMMAKGGYKDKEKLISDIRGFLKAPEKRENNKSYQPKLIKAMGMISALGGEVLGGTTLVEVALNTGDTGLIKKSSDLRRERSMFNEQREALRAASKQDTVEAYTDFMNQYPDAKVNSQVKGLIDKKNEQKKLQEQEVMKLKSDEMWDIALDPDNVGLNEMQLTKELYDAVGHDRSFRPIIQDVVGSIDFTRRLKNAVNKKDIDAIKQLRIKNKDLLNEFRNLEGRYQEMYEGLKEELELIEDTKSGEYIKLSAKMKAVAKEITNLENNKAEILSAITEQREADVDSAGTLDEGAIESEAEGIASREFAGQAKKPLIDFGKEGIAKDAVKRLQEQYPKSEITSEGRSVYKDGELLGHFDLETNEFIEASRIEPKETPEPATQEPVKTLSGKFASMSKYDRR